MHPFSGSSGATFNYTYEDSRCRFPNRDWRCVERADDFDYKASSSASSSSHLRPSSRDLSAVSSFSRTPELDASRNGAIQRVHYAPDQSGEGCDGRTSTHRPPTHAIHNSSELICIMSSYARTFPYGLGSGFESLRTYIATEL